MPPSKRDELIDAAMRVFYRHGFHTGIDKVLQEGGISRMTLYNHFKSKDELIVAALNRRDEIFRNDMMKFVESQGNDPVDRIFAVFDYHAEWFGASDFSGCMFINVAAEFEDTDCRIRRTAALHKGEVVRYLTELCEQADLDGPGALARQLSILLEGSIVTAQVLCKVDRGESPGDTAKQARAAARTLIDAATVGSSQ